MTGIPYTYTPLCYLPAAVAGVCLHVDTTAYVSSYLRRHSGRRGQGLQSRLSVCLFVCAVSGKPLELSTPHLVHVYSIVVTQHALTQKSKGQRSRSHGYENRAVARLLVAIAGATYSCATCGRCRRGSACRYDCLCFLVYRSFENVTERLRTTAWCCRIYQRMKCKARLATLCNRVVSGVLLAYSQLYSPS